MTTNNTEYTEQWGNFDDIDYLEIESDTMCLENNRVVSSTMSEVMALMDDTTDTIINIDVHNINLFNHFKQ